MEVPCARVPTPGNYVADEIAERRRPKARTLPSTINSEV
jgi:hypothetical protein